MSLILEALRKSEAQRRLGQAPDLLSPMPGAQRAARRWLRGIGLVGVLIAVAGMAWWLGQRRAAPAPAAAVRAAASMDTTTAAMAAAAPAPDAALPAPSIPAAAPPAPSAPPPHAGNATPPMAGAPRQIATAGAAADAPAPRIAAPAAPAATATPVLPAPALAPPFAPDPAALPPEAAAAPPLPGLGALSSSARQGLPPLRITMHVYADAAARRFAIIDGQRVGEGARLSDGVSVAEIARDGVVLDVRGQRLWLPRP